MNAIELYLQTAYSDEQLAALDNHIEAGKLSYFSCCCFTGCATADHELQEGNSTYIGDHMKEALRLRTSGTGRDTLRRNLD